MAPKRCPPGVFCLTPGLVAMIVTVIVIAIGILFYVTSTSKPMQIVVSAPAPSTVPPSSVIVPPTPPPQIVGDSRYTPAPEPLRDWFAPPDLRGALVPRGAVPIFQPTRG